MRRAEVTISLEGVQADALLAVQVNRQIELQAGPVSPAPGGRTVDVYHSFDPAFLDAAGRNRVTVRVLPVRSVRVRLPAIPIPRSAGKGIPSKPPEAPGAGGIPRVVRVTLRYLHGDA